MAEYAPAILFERLRALALEEGSYAVFGSGPLAVRGLIDAVGDLDVIVSQTAWERLRPLGEMVMYGEIETVDMGNGLTFGRSWAHGDFDIEALVADAELIDGLPFVRVDAVLQYKKIAGRPKDLAHVEQATAAGLAS